MLKKLLLVVLASTALGGQPITLTDANFDHDTQIGAGMTTGSWFIKFYAPWCSHCKKMNPAWEELVDELREEGINVANVDATTEQGLAARFDIKGYPTLLFFNTDKMWRYKGPRDVEALSSYAKGEFRKTAFVHVPPPLGWMGRAQKRLTNLSHDLEIIWVQRRLAGGFLAVLGMTVGTTFGFMVGSVLTARATLSAEKVAAGATGMQTRRAAAAVNKRKAN